ncbi:MAG TPA: hypothetical protein VMV92_10110 [Streptosporangiaceae bacterium]|nr:hypothetical protein [Streptosporangiaceae bacterium]
MSYPHFSGDCDEHHDLVRDFGGDRPRIVCLCGSTRFYDQFQQANYDLTMAGEIVLSVGFYPHAKAEHGHGEGVGHDSAEKVALDELHKRKIDLCDRVLVVSDESGYYGESTRSEIEYARAAGKPVEFMVAPPVPVSAGREIHELVFTDREARPAKWQTRCGRTDVPVEQTMTPTPHSHYSVTCRACQTTARTCPGCQGILHQGAKPWHWFHDDGNLSCPRPKWVMGCKAQ